jgi:hypothetical protein
LKNNHLYQIFEQTTEGVISPIARLLPTSNFPILLNSKAMKNYLLMASLLILSSTHLTAQFTINIHNPTGGGCYVNDVLTATATTNISGITRNTFTDNANNGGFPIRMIYTTTGGGRWEVQADFDPHDGVFESIDYYSTVQSYPNPPTLDFGNWVKLAADCGALSLSSTNNGLQCQLTPLSSDPSVFGTNIWHVYAWDAGGAPINANSWTTNFKGFYTNSSLSFNSADSWDKLTSPSSAVTAGTTTAYQGCPVANDNHSWSAKRRGFPCGYYQLDVPNHDDGVQLWINDNKVFEHDGCCDAHSNVWSGFLGTNDQIEFRVTEGTGESKGQLTLNLISVPTTTTNNALNFNGSNNFVEITNCAGTPLSITNALTIEYWFKGSNNHSAVRFQPVGGDYIVAGWNGRHILSNDGGTATGIKVSPTTGASATDGNWHHIAMTWQQGATNGFKSYLDGELVEQRNAANVALPSFSTGLYLGAYLGSSEFMNGTIDEVRVWNVVRTQTEIQNNRMGCTTLAGTSGLLLYYQFNHGTAEGSNTSIQTLPNSANSGTYLGILRNFTKTGTSSNFIASPLCTDSYTWTGAVSTDWANLYNWSPTVVPTSTSSITIPATTNKITLTSPQTVNQLNFSGNAKVILGNNNLIANQVNNGSANAFVVTNGTGGLTIKNISTTPILFPVGPSETVYSPATITNNASARDFTVKVGTTIIQAAQLPNSVGLQWDITPSVSTGNSVTLALGWSASSQLAGFNPSSSIRIAHHNGTTWDNFKSATVSGTNPYTATASGITAFSPFIVTNQSVLPVELLSFKGQNTEGGNLLTWQTAEEKNARDFDIERSRDGQLFTKIGETKAKGSNSTYEFLDDKTSARFGTSPTLGLAYYRLKINDLDGKFDYSKTISIQSKGKGAVKIYPSVTTGDLTIENVASFEIINSMGQVVLSQTMPIHHSQVTIHNSPSGIYFVKGYDTEGGIFSEKIVKQ